MMNKIVNAAALVATAVSSAAAAGTLQWTSGNGVCAGGYESCENTQECTYVGVGPCTAGEAAPAWHVANTFVGMAFVADGYTTNASKMETIDMKPGSKGFRKAEDDKVANPGTKYAYAMAANMFGADNTAYGYAGVASYLNTGTQTISVTQNKFMAFTDYASTMTEASSDFKEYDICISEMTGAVGAATCNTPVTFAPGTFKFSIFGNTLGDNWATTISNFGTDKTMMGFRMKIASVGITFDKVTLNGNVDIADIGETDVEDIKIENADTVLEYKFPKKFNYASTTNVNDDDNRNKDLQTGDIKIIVQKIAGENALYIDYGFPLDKIGRTGDQYFVYDPEVSASKSGAAQLAASGFVAFVVAAVSQLF